MSNGFDIYTCCINIDSLEMKEDSMFIDDEFDPDPDDYGYALYNEDGFGNIYAESLVSSSDAREIVRCKCKELAEKFAACESHISRNNAARNALAFRNSRSSRKRRPTL